jgi:plasmid stability protein
VASLTIRDLDDSVKKKLRVQAAQHGRSMEDEARHILRMALSQKAPAPLNMYDCIRRRIEPLGGVDLEIPPRSRRMREPPNFE